MGAGYAPIAAALASEKVMEPILNGTKIVMSGHTLSANPQACAVSLAVIEYLERKEVLNLLKKVESWARKMILIYTPNGKSKRIRNEFNPYNRYRSAWSVGDLKNLGYDVKGYLGWKNLRGLDGTIRYSPSYILGIISNLSEKFVYNHPKYAYELSAFKFLA